MGKVSSSDAFEILVKDDRKRILEKFGMQGFVKIKIYFIDNVDDTVDVNDGSIKEIYNITITNGDTISSHN